MDKQITRKQAKNAKKPRTNNTKSAKKTTPRKVGKPPWIPPDPKKVEALAAQGLLQKEIAAALGIHVSTLCEKKNQYKEFAEAIERGQAQGAAIVTNSLMQQCQKGNVNAIMFYLKTRLGWKETIATENKHTHEILSKDQVERIIGKL